jgi:hypothetical protein
LNFDPAPELNTLRSVRHAVQELTVTESSPLLLNDMKGDCTEIVAEINPGTVTQVGIRVRSTVDGSEQTLIGYDNTDKMLFSDTSKYSVNRPAARSGCDGPGGSRNPGMRRGSLSLAEKEPLRLHICGIYIIKGTKLKLSGTISIFQYCSTAIVFEVL